MKPASGPKAGHRRRPVRGPRELTSGPGKLCQALGIDRTYNGEDLLGARVWVEDAEPLLADEEIASGARVGVAYAGADALKPWRFWLKGSEYVSRKTS